MFTNRNWKKPWSVYFQTKVMFLFNRRCARWRTKALFAKSVGKWIAEILKFSSSVQFWVNVQLTEEFPASRWFARFISADVCIMFSLFPSNFKTIRICLKKLKHKLCSVSFQFGGNVVVKLTEKCDSCMQSVTCARAAGIMMFCSMNCCDNTNLFGFDPYKICFKFW